MSYSCLMQDSRNYIFELQDGLLFEIARSIEDSSRFHLSYPVPNGQRVGFGSSRFYLVGLERCRHTWKTLLSFAIVTCRRARFHLVGSGSASFPSMRISYPDKHEEAPNNVAKILGDASRTTKDFSSSVKP
ncbi:unnamed protein product [Citrullus colocynthis]|uniref:Uncharacterized protein n=1 Tax=Citrullus colocynthis TaxID=252529 RepID=A0ABP0YWG4_9ROSI